MTEIEWNKYLKRMAMFFSKAANENNLYKIRDSYMKDGMVMFVERFWDLWD